MTALREASRAIIRASMALDRNHPDQGALYAAHAVLVSTIATERHTALVDHSQDAVASVLGRESVR